MVSPPPNSLNRAIKDMMVTNHAVWLSCFKYYEVECGRTCFGVFLELELRVELPWCSVPPFDFSFSCSRAAVWWNLDIDAHLLMTCILEARVKISGMPFLPGNLYCRIFSSLVLNHEFSCLEGFYQYAQLS